MEENMKVGIIGMGAVGSACLLSLVLRGSAREIVAVNRNRKRAEGARLPSPAKAFNSVTPLDSRIFVSLSTVCATE
jgi:malate/lactate dehydrogenase